MLEVFVQSTYIMLATCRREAEAVSRSEKRKEEVLKIALIGETGAGKTSFLRMILI